MKSRDSLSTQAVIDLWMRSIELEFGTGWHTATLRRLMPAVRRLLDSSDAAQEYIFQFGYEMSIENHDLAFTTRCFQMLRDDLIAGHSRPHIAVALSDRTAAVQLADGWNTGVLDRSKPLRANLTPTPILLHLLRQRYVETDVDTAPSRRIVLVVVDVQEVVCSRLEFARLCGAVLRHLQGVFTSGEPISEGPNGNLIAVANRGSHTVQQVARLTRALEADDQLAQQQLRVWMEPLSDDAIHLESHLSSILGRLPELDPPDND